MPNGTPGRALNSMSPLEHVATTKPPQGGVLRYLPALLCGSILVLGIALAHPVVNMGWGDEWSYMWSARILANTGKIVYNGYTQPMLGWLLYWGALFIKLLGFSFATLRISMIPVGFCALALTQRIFVRFGATERNATVAALAIAFSPVYFFLSYSYMTDIPGYFSLALCVYGCLRAVQAGTNRTTLAWLIFASSTNLVGGTARQIAWLGTLVIVPSTVWLLRRRKGALVTGTILWVTSLIVVLACVHWFERQPYSIPEPLLQRPLTKDALVELVSTLIRTVLYVCLFLSPVLVGFIVKYPLQNVVARKRAIGMAVLFAAAIVFLVLRHRPIYWLAPFEFNTYYADRVGGLLGTPLPAPLFGLRVSLTIVTFAALAVTLCFFGLVESSEPVPATGNLMQWTTIFTMLGPYSVAYVLLYVTRDPIFERYLLPLFLMVTIFILRLYRQKIGGQLPIFASSVLLAIIGGIFSVAPMHDIYAGYRARLIAANELRASGVPRTEIRGGYEYDGWTQLEATGYLNNRNIHNPANAYHPYTPPAVPEQCRLAFSNFLSAIHPRYELSMSPTSCFLPSEFPPIPYSTWLSPHSRAIYIQEVK